MINRAYKKYKLYRGIGLNQSICCAPSGNLLFQPDGSVYTCNYNRGVKLGNYPTESVDAIWRGAIRKNFTEILAKNKVAAGCELCTNNIKNGLYDLADCYKYEFIRKELHDFPSQMEFQISNVCNFECFVCSGEYSSGIRKNREHLQPVESPYDIEFVKQIREFLPTLGHASFTGGEPFLNKLYYSIWNEISDINRNAQVAVSTNGSIWNNNTEKIFEKLNASIVISIDSLNNDIYSKIRKKDSLEEVLKNANRIAELSMNSNVNLLVKFLVMPVNLKTIPGLFEHFNNINIPLIPKFVLHPILASMLVLPEAEIHKAVAILESGLVKFIDSTEIQKINIARYKNIIDQLRLWEKSSVNTKLRHLQTKSPEELVSLVKKHILSYSKNQHFVFSKKAVINQCFEMLAMLVSEIEEQDKLQRTLIGILLLQPSLLISELQRDSKELIFSRFMQNANIIVEDFSIQNYMVSYETK